MDSPRAADRVLDTCRKAIVKAAKETGAILTVENQNVVGNLGSAVAEVVSADNLCPVQRFGIQDEFGEVGSLDYLVKRYGLTPEDIAKAAKELLRKKKG